MRLRSLVIKFEEYTKDPKHTMSEHLRVMSNMIGKLRDAGHALIDEQQVRAVIRSLPASWANMKQILTHSENIKNFSDVSQHVILEAETQDADKTLTYVAQEGSRNANGKRGRQKSDFPSIGDASKNLDLYELEEVEPTLPSPSEGGELVPHPVIAEDSVSDLQPSGSIPDSGSTPQGPLGQQDSQLRRAGNDMSSIVSTKQWLSSTFEMKDMGEANYVLGVKIYPSHLRLCHEEDTQCRYFSMYPWIMDDAVSQGMSGKAVGSNWNDMRALGRKFNITPCCVIHSPGDFVDFRFDMSHEYITYERFNTAHYEGFESV
ncbi:hypothetical protein RJ640_014594 [Escallonia rubra]|uniref:UBN2_2 domain-containing protein n=1 Tax=Escallonia rubra TaxID=112253 RepID=A0AA88R5Y9_9ASTE|nr:hypothetical protein RJ640_014594 [Escallonia rubra]